jgi:hypothetical protein
MGFFGGSSSKDRHRQRLILAQQLEQTKKEQAIQDRLIATGEKFTSAGQQILSGLTGTGLGITEEVETGIRESVGAEFEDRSAALAGDLSRFGLLQSGRGKEAFAKLQDLQARTLFDRFQQERQFQSGLLSQFETAAQGRTALSQGQSQLIGGLISGQRQTASNIANLKAAGKTSLFSGIGSIIGAGVGIASGNPLAAVKGLAGLGGGQT